MIFATLGTRYDEKAGTVASIMVLGKTPDNLEMSAMGHEDADEVE